jgi:hypothetical protein
MITSLYVIILIIIKVIKIIVKNNIVLFYKMEMNYVAFIFVFMTILQSIEGQENLYSGVGAVRNTFSKTLYGLNKKTSCGSVHRIGMKYLGFRQHYYAAPKLRALPSPSILQEPVVQEPVVQEPELNIYPGYRIPGNYIPYPGSTTQPYYDIPLNETNEEAIQKATGLLNTTINGQTVKAFVLWIGHADPDTNRRIYLKYSYDNIEPNPSPNSITVYSYDNITLPEPVV